MYEDIAKNVAEAREKILAAAKKTGRDGSEITLLAATKTMPAEAVKAAVAAGVDACGENRVQEMTEKLALSAYDGAPLHFIGHLQKNKVKQVVGKVSLIQSVDSPQLMSLVSKRAAELGIVQRILLEVNIGGEASKSGVLKEDLPRLLDSAGGFSGVFVAGLMAIPPNEQNSAESMQYFEQMYKLFVDIKGKKYDNVAMDVLSMGMSADYELAVAAGANIVRIGTGIFGARTSGTKIG